MNQWWLSLSTKQKKQLARRTRTAMRSGASQAAATGAAAQTMGYTPAPAPAPAPAAPAAPSYAAITYRQPTSKKATQAQAGRSPVRGARDSEQAAKTKLSSLRIKRNRRKKTEKKEGLTAASSSGTGLNIGGY